MYWEREHHFQIPSKTVSFAGLWKMDGVVVVVKPWLRFFHPSQTATSLLEGSPPSSLPS